MNSLAVLIAVLSGVTVAIPIEDRNTVVKCSPTCQAGFVCRSGTCEPYDELAGDCAELQDGLGCYGSEIHIGSGTTPTTCKTACAALGADGCCEWQAEWNKCMFTEGVVPKEDSKRTAAVCYKKTGCNDYNGFDHPSKNGKCCASTCGEFCGAPNCQKGPGGSRACCSGSYDLKTCGMSGQMAPCILA